LRRGRGPADRATGCEDARAAYFAQVRSVSLSDRPGPVLEDLDGHARGDAEVKVELTLEVLKVAVPIDEPRQYRASRDLDDVRTLWGSHLTAAGNPLEPTALDHDRRALKRRAAGTVNECSTFDDEQSIHREFHSPQSGRSYYAPDALPILTIVKAGRARDAFPPLEAAGA